MSSVPGEYNFPPIVRGDTFGINNLGSISGYTFSINTNLNGYKIKMWIKSSCGDGPNREMSTEDGTIVIAGADPDNEGYMLFYIKPFTFNLPAGTCYYDIQFTSPPDEAGQQDINTFVKGQIIVLNDITQ